jgi:hypothetical protein
MKIFNLKDIIYFIKNNKIISGKIVELHLYLANNFLTIHGSYKVQIKEKISNTASESYTEVDIVNAFASPEDIFEILKKSIQVSNPPSILI